MQYIHSFCRENNIRRVKFKRFWLIKYFDLVLDFRDFGDD